MNFDLTGPCHDCPFRSDKLFYLRQGRKVQIWHDLTRGDKTFVCHNTTSKGRRDWQHCGGALVLLWKTGEFFANWCLRYAAAKSWLNTEKLKLDAPVFNTAAEFLEERE